MNDIVIIGRSYSRQRSQELGYIRINTIASRQKVVQMDYTASSLYIQQLSPLDYMKGVTP